MKNSHEEGSRAQKKSVRKSLSKALQVADKSPPKVRVAVALREEPTGPEQTPGTSTMTQGTWTMTPGTPTMTPTEPETERTSPDSDKSQPVKTEYYLSLDESYYTNEKYLETVTQQNETGSANGVGNVTMGQPTFVQTDVVIEDEQKIHACQECGMKFTSRELLEEHFTRHSGDRPFACEICDRRFGAKFALRSHLLSHDEEYTEKLKSQLKRVNDATNESRLLSANSRAEETRALGQSLPKAR